MKSVKRKLQIWKQSLRIVAGNYFSHSVGRNGAALAYYLLFTLFPVLIFVSNLLGLLQLDVATITKNLQTILPNDMVALIETYLVYVSESSRGSMLWFSLIFSIYFPARATRSLMNNVRLAYHLPKPEKPIRYGIRQVIYTIIFFIVITLILVIATTGQSVLEHLFRLLRVSDEVWISDVLLTLWHYLRYGLLAVIMFAALGLLYAMSQDQRQPVTAILPGTVLALLAWLGISIAFSFYVENFASYSVIYGTLGTVIVLLIWLYITAVILILGAEWNAALRTVKEEKRES